MMDEVTSNLHQEIGDRIIAHFPLVLQRLLTDDWGIKVSGARLLEEGKEEIVVLTFQLPSVEQMELFNTQWGLRFNDLLLYFYQQKILTVHTLFLRAEDHPYSYAWMPLTNIREAVLCKERENDYPRISG
jgi:hypothetical protein